MKNISTFGRNEYVGKRGMADGVVRTKATGLFTGRGNHCEDGAQQVRRRGPAGPGAKPRNGRATPGEQLGALSVSGLPSSNALRRPVGLGGVVKTVSNTAAMAPARLRGAAGSHTRLTLLTSTLALLPHVRGSIDVPICSYVKASATSPLVRDVKHYPGQEKGHYY